MDNNTNNNGIADENDPETGEIKISGPGNNGVILPNSNLSTPGDGVTGSSGSLLIVPVKVGSKAGKYIVSISMKYSNEIKTYIIAE